MIKTENEYKPKTKGVKKIFKTLATIAITAAMAVSATGLAACKDNKEEVTPRVPVIEIEEDDIDFMLPNINTNSKDVHEAKSAFDKNAEALYGMESKYNLFSADDLLDSIKWSELGDLKLDTEKPTFKDSIHALKYCIAKTLESNSYNNDHYFNINFDWASVIAKYVIQNHSQLKSESFMLDKLSETVTPDFHKVTFKSEIEPTTNREYYKIEVETKYTDGAGIVSPNPNYEAKIKSFSYVDSIKQQIAFIVDAKSNLILAMKERTATFGAFKTPNETHAPLKDVPSYEEYNCVRFVSADSQIFSEYNKILETDTSVEAGI